MMDIADAFQIVLDLAKQNTISPHFEDAELVAERKRQEEAINLVEDYVVNQLSDE